MSKVKKKFELVYILQSVYEKYQNKNIIKNKRLKNKNG